MDTKLQLITIKTEGHHNSLWITVKLNRRRLEMEAAVTTVLAENRLTAWDVFGFKPSRRTALQAAGDGVHLT